MTPRPASHQYPRLMCCLASGMSFVAGLLTLCIPASAQTPSTAPPELAFSADIGWNGNTLCDRWNPLRINVTGGESPIGGTVIVEAGLGQSALWRTAARFAATPGATTSFDLALFMPDTGDRSGGLWLDVHLDAEGGRDVRQRFAVTPSRSTAQLTLPMDDDTVLIGEIGDSTVRAAGEQWRSRIVDGEPDDPWTGVNVISLLNRSLPSAALAYESLSLLMIEGEAIDTAEDAAVGAIRRWVESGGRLVLMPTAPGQRLDRWLAQDPVTIQLVADAAGTGTMSVGITPGGRSVGWATRDLEYIPAAPAAIDTDEPKPAEPLVGEGDLERIVTYGRDEPPMTTPLPLPEQSEGPESPPWIAEGPVGNGWVMVLSRDPARIVGTEQAAAAWEGLLRPMLRMPMRLATGEGDPWWAMEYRRARLNPLLDAVARDMGDATAIPGWWLIGPILALAILIGPVDRYVLGRTRRLHRSWLTAIGWVGVCSVAAFVLPGAIRQRDTALRRVRVIDGVGGQPTASTSGLLATFFGAGGNYPLAGVDPASWWAPAEARSFFNNAPASLGALETVQAGGCIPGAISARVWTFRTLMDESSAACPYGASVRWIAPSDAWSVSVTGPPGFAPTIAAIRSDLGWRSLDLTETDGAWTGEAGLGSVVEELASWQVATERLSWIENPWEMRRHEWDVRNDPGIALELPGARRRTQVRELALETGRWVEVCFVTGESTPDVTIEQALDSSAVTMVRLLVPLTLPEASTP